MIEQQTHEQTMSGSTHQEAKSGTPWSWIVIAIAIIAIVAGIAYFVLQGGDLRQFLPTTSEAVAIVNGEEIAKSEYEKNYKSAEATLATQGQDTASAEAQSTLREQTLDGLIAGALILQEAKKEGLSVDAGVIDSTIEQNKASFPDEAAFNQALDAQGLTPDTLRSLLADQLLIQKYISTRVDLTSISATEGEVTAFYNQLAATNANIPALAAIRSNIENEVVRQKQQQLLATLIQGLKDKSTIEILI